MGALPRLQEVLVKLSTPPEPTVRVLPAPMPTVPTATLEVARLLTVTSAVIDGAVVFSLMLSVARVLFETTREGE